MSLLITGGHSPFLTEFPSESTGATRAVFGADTEMHLMAISYCSELEAGARAPWDGLQPVTSHFPGICVFSAEGQEATCLYVPCWGGGKVHLLSHRQGMDQPMEWGVRWGAEWGLADTVQLHGG